jgi:hypothetical protein
VEIDVIRDEEDVAIVIQDLSVKGRDNESNLYVNKAFTPPIYKEQGAISAYKMIARLPGANPFQDPNFGASAVLESFRIFRKLENKIKRAVELMASQVLQTGQLTLNDQNGTALYTLNFQPKASHFVTTTAWPLSGASGDPLLDLANLATLLRTDGKGNPKILAFGAGAFQRFLRNPTVQANLNALGLQLGKVVPQSRGQGATFQGYIYIGHYQFEMWTYDGFYRHPQTGVMTPFLGDNKVVMLSENGRLDLTFGSIPMFIQPDQRAMPFLPPRISDGGRGIDLTTNAYVTESGEQLMVSAGTRPLTIPTAIDTFGCLTVF